MYVAFNWDLHQCKPIFSIISKKNLFWLLLLKKVKNRPKTPQSTIYTRTPEIRSPQNPELPKIRTFLAVCNPLIKSFKMAQTRCFYLYWLGSYDFLKI